MFVHTMNGEHAGVWCHWELKLYSRLQNTICWFNLLWIWHSRFGKERERERERNHCSYRVRNGADWQSLRQFLNGLHLLGLPYVLRVILSEVQVLFFPSVCVCVCVPLIVGLVIHIVGRRIFSKKIWKIS